MWNFNDAERIALVDDTGTRVTYRQLHTESQRLGEHMPERCLVFSLCTNGIGSVVGYVSFLNHRIVPLLLNSKLDFSLLQSLISLYKPTFLWLPDDMRDSFGFRPVYADRGYTLLKTGFPESYPLFDELALLLTTSGSTGSPKLVRQSYRNIESNMKSIAQYLALDETERPVTTLPMNYTYGLSIINSHLYVGATILLTDKTVVEKDFWIFLRENEATSFGGVPYTYEMLDRMRFSRMQLPSLKTLTQAGGKLSVELHKRFADYAKQNAIRFVVMYGATEATARMSYLPHKKSAEKYGSIGIAIPGGRFYLVDDDGKKIDEPHVTGELVYEGDNVTLGYAECGEDLAKGDERLSRLVTGDMAQVDEDGYYFIVGRRKRFLKIFGNRVNLDEVERLIKSGFTQLDCACAGEDDNMCVFITDKALESDVNQLLAQKTGLNHAAFHIRTVDSIPRNDAGKTLYAQLKMLLDDGDCNGIQ